LTYRPWQPDVVCVSNTDTRPELASITVASECWSCGDLQGPCGVEVQPRITRDFPPGGDLHIRTTTHTTFCDVDCPDVCHRSERICDVPPLTPGHFYRVWLDGIEVQAFTAGVGTSACVHRDGPVPG